MINLPDFLALMTFLIALYAATVGTALWAGRGLCQRCGDICPPWRTYCWRHTPHP